MVGGKGEVGYKGGDMKRFGMVLAGMAMAAALSAGGREVSLTVLHTTDLHGVFDRGQAGREAGDWGLAECATLIREARKGSPNCLLLDGGDFAQGTPASLASGGLRMVEAMNLLRYDAVALGNHEFDWGFPAASAMAEALEAPLLAANFRAGETARAGFKGIKPYIVKEVDGLRVAVVGLTTPNLPNWFLGFAAEGLETEGSREALERVLPQVKAEKADVIIVLAHQGLLVKDDAANEINSIGDHFPEIDLLLGGHLHWVQAGARVGDVDYAQSGSGGRGVMRIDLTVDTAAKKVTEKRFAWLPVEKDTPADGTLLALAREDLAAEAASMDAVVGRARRTMAGTRTGACLGPLQQLLAGAMKDATGADAAMQGTLATARLAAGDIRRRDVWALVPYENRVGVLHLTPDEIRAAMEDSMDLWGTDRYVPLSGIAYDLYPNAERGNRVRNLRWRDGKPIHPRRRVAVAFNSYLLAGGGGRFPAVAELAGRPETRLEWADGTLRSMVETRIARLGELDIPSGTEARVFRRERRPWEREEAFENSLE